MGELQGLSQKIWNNLPQKPVARNTIHYHTIQVFKVPSKFAEGSSETEMPTTTHRWLGKNLGERITFECTFKTSEQLDLTNGGKNCPTVLEQRNVKNSGVHLQVCMDKAGGR